MLTSLVSVFYAEKSEEKMAMTGEITLQVKYCL
jgi:ATP-dependent Lon protease